MQIIQAILRACGADIEHITMAHCFLVDNTKERFAEMNAGYLEFMNGNPLPARSECSRNSVDRTALPQSHYSCITLAALVFRSHCGLHCPGARLMR